MNGPQNLRAASDLRVYFTSSDLTSTTGRADFVGLVHNISHVTADGYINLLFTSQ